MNEEQLQQAVHAYFAHYDLEFMARWQQQHWAPQMEPAERRRPEQKSRTSLQEARPGDKLNAIDVEYVRVR